MIVDYREANSASCRVEALSPVPPDYNSNIQYSMEHLAVFSSFHCIVCKFCIGLMEFYGFSAISTGYIYSRAVLREW